MNFVYIHQPFQRISIISVIGLKNVVKVLAIGDTPYDELSDELKNSY